MSATSLRALVRKDLQVFFADRRAVLMSFVLPIAFASFFSFVFRGGQGGDSETTRIPISVVDRDGSDISREILSSIASDKNLESKNTTVEEGREAVRKGKTTVVIVIPAGFGAEAGKAFFSTAKKPELELLYDPSHNAELAMVRGILTQHVMQSVSKEMFSGKGTRQFLEETQASLGQNSRMPSEDKKALQDMLQSINTWYERADSGGTASQGEARGGLTMPYEVREEAVTARQGVAYNGFAHSFSGMGVQFTLMMAVEAGVSILLQRQRGLWKRLRAAPLSRHVLLAGRIISAAIICLLILFVLFAFGRVVFGVRIEGSFLGFLGVCTACALMASAFGLLVASLGNSPDATRPIAFFFTLIMVMLGGAWVPAFIFPPWLQKLTLLVPTRWAVDGLEAMSWRGMDFTAALAPMGVLLGFAALFAAVGVARFRWEEE